MDEKKFNVKIVINLEFNAHPKNKLHHDNIITSIEWAIQDIPAEQFFDQDVGEPEESWLDEIGIEVNLQ